MMKTLLTTSLLCSLPLALFASDEQETRGLNTLWYKQPAGVPGLDLPWSQERTPHGNLEGKKANDTWESQTLPIGNGRVGATVYGGDQLDCVVLNEVTLWSGGPNKPGNGSGYSYGPQAGEEQFGSYQPFGRLLVQNDGQGEVKDYERGLNIESGVAYTKFTQNGLKHTRECKVSADGRVDYTWRTEEGSFSGRIAMPPFHNVNYTVDGSKTIIMRGKLANGQEFEGRMYIHQQGGNVKIVNQSKSQEVSYEGNGDSRMPSMVAVGIPYFEVSDAKGLAVHIVMATDYAMDANAIWKGQDPGEYNKKIIEQGLNSQKKAERINEKLFSRVSINLGESSAELRALPTDERLERYRKGGQDPELESLIFQYGRYLLIAGSRPREFSKNLPANLQGIWNDKVHAPWASDYHNNINLQMCYWGAEVGNLSECHTPLLDFMSAMEKPLQEMTKRAFGENTPGWTTRISQNPWGGGGWVKWNPPVNAWYALHLWDHYLFTQDKKYLAEQAYPLMKNICFFWQHHLKEIGAEGAGLMSDGKPLSAEKHPELKELKAGTLVSPQGWSHEWGPIEDGCMHDQQLIGELFENTARAAEILGQDKKWAKDLLKTKALLAPQRIGKDGYLQEWIVDRPDMVAGHRHTSHLVGVYPGTSISMEKTPDLAQAAMKSLELRGLSGDNRRSWTWPWRTALWSRFLQPEKAYDMVRNYLTHNVLDNLAGNHPPMQMDGAYGITGGMSEMFLQSHAGLIEILPALPKAWPTGYVKGLKARGNITVDIQWKDGKVTNYRLRSPQAQNVKVRVEGKVTEVTTQKL